MFMAEKQFVNQDIRKCTSTLQTSQNACTFGSQNQIMFQDIMLPRYNVTPTDNKIPTFRENLLFLCSEI